MSYEIHSPAFKVSLRQWLTARRWFGGKARAIVRVHMADVLPLPLDGAALMLLRVEYTFGPAEIYQLMFVERTGEARDRLAAEFPDAVVHRFDAGADGQAKWMFDALVDKDFASGLLELLSGTKKVAAPSETPMLLRGIGRPGGLVAAASVPQLSEIMEAGSAKFRPEPLSADQSNSCVVYGRRLFLKMFRKLVPGVNPELEIGRFLSAGEMFSHTPALYGSLEYRSTHADSEPLTLGVLQQFTPGRSAWETTLDSLQTYFERVAQLPADERPSAADAFQTVPVKAGEAASDRSAPSGALWALTTQQPVAIAEQLAGDALRKIALLGRRTAELHLALAAETDDQRFAPEPFTEKQQQSLRWSMRDLASRTCELLRQRLSQVPPDAESAAGKLLSQESRLLARFDEIVVEPIDGQRIRCHGDYHLGQVIDVGDDFMIIDFEGEPGRSLEERRNKRTPLTDVAGMIRSLHYAASQAVFKQLRSAEAGSMDRTALRSAGDCWYRWSVAAFLGAYRSAAAAGKFLPRSPAICERLLGALVLEKAVYELAYELNNRPDWVEVPLAGLLEMLGQPR